MKESTFNYIILAWTFVGLCTFVYLLFKTAPYGRHSNTNWGPMIDNRLGWFIMEIVVLLQMAFFLLRGSNSLSIALIVVCSFFVIHYINRAIIFPLRLRTKGKKMPLLIMLSAVGFNLVNGFQIGYYFGNYAEYELTWMLQPRFLIGVVLFLIGFAVNQWSDQKLIRLRKPADTHYHIPRGGLFNYISCPNHFGEILEWLGFAILSWSLAGASFFIWTCCNLIPRALDHHKWYKQQFSDYPANRKALIPGIL